MSRVPHLGRSPTPPTSHTDTQSQSPSPVAQPHSQSHVKPKLVTANSAPPRSEYSSPVAQDPTAAHWTRRRHTSSFPQPLQAPYETPLELPTGTRSRAWPTAMVAHPPPSPPDSPSYSSAKSDTPPPHESPAKAIPGTMTSRASRIQGDTKLRSRSQGHAHSHRNHPDQRPISKRFTSAFRGMFKKDPVDESSLERISDRHWTEEN